jgi:putrescine transport system ATP-binding protein
MTVSSRIAVMDRGRIVQVSTPGELYEAPSTRYVADFIGEVNILEGRGARREGDHLLLQSPEAGCIIQTGPFGEEAGDRSLWIALRPEKIRISKEAPGDTSRNCMTGEVWDIGYIGNLSTYHVKLDSGKMVSATQANMARLIERPITWEDRVYLTWAPDAAVVLRD